MTVELTRKNLGFDYESPVYRYGPLQTTATNVLCVPLIYGRVKAAGNKLWQSAVSNNAFSTIVCFSEGLLSSFSDVRINDNPIADLSGCSYGAYLGDSIQTIDSRVTGTTQAEKAALVGGLKYNAYLALTITQSDKVTSGYMNVTANIVGKTVKVYTDTSTYTNKYSSNPAWCLLDFLTCYNGCGLSIDKVDISSFITAAAYCDEKINPVNATGTVGVAVNSSTVTGSGTKFLNEVNIGDQVSINGTNKVVTAINSDTSLTVDSNFTSSSSSQTMIIKDPRYSINIILDERKSRLDWLAAMLLTCRGELVYKGDKMALIIEQDDESVQTFTPDDIIAKSEIFWTTPKYKKCDIARVRYIDQNKDYSRVYAIAEADSFLSDPPIVQEIEAYGVTTFKQASRLAWYFLNQANNCNKFISFRTTKKALDRTVNDVVSITSTFLGYQNKKMRIIQISELPNGQFEIVCRENNGAQSASLATALTGNNNDLVFTSVAQTDDSNSITMQYTDPYATSRALSVAVSNKDINISLATDSSGAIASTAAQIKTAIEANQNASALITVTNAFGNDGSGIVTAMAKTTLTGGTTGIYTDKLGTDKPIINVVNLQDVLDTPDDIINFSAAQNLNSIILNWQQINNSQTTYEIREGNSWNESQIIAQKLTGTTYTVLNIQKGTYKYWVKPLNAYGNYSNNAKLVTIIISNIPDTNTIIHEDILDSDLSVGTFSNSYSANNRVVLEANSNWTNSGTWTNSGQNYALDGFWGSDCVNTGSYTTKIYDLGLCLDSIISANYNLYSRDNAGNLVVEWKYSQDNITWSDWQMFSQGSYNFRFYQFKITLNSPNNKFLALTNFIVNIDITNRDLYFEDKLISDANSGVTVNFNPVFTNIPAIVANISDGTNGYCVVSAKSTSQATVKAYNNSGTAITAKIDIRIKGY